MSSWSAFHAKLGRVASVSRKAKIWSFIAGLVTYSTQFCYNRGSFYENVCSTKNSFFPVGILVSSSEQHLRVPLFLCTRIMISKGIVSKGQYPKFWTVKGFHFSVLNLKKIRVKEGSPVLIFGSSKGVLRVIQY